jgi:alkylation response protein AidB-like acyl-CoA dehydrogenase
MGHGTDVSSLETTATLDLKTDEWIINTPNIRATKFWPGALGIQSNYALTFARGIVGENDYGVLPFLVPIRDNNHMPFQGVKVGAIG